MKRFRRGLVFKAHRLLYHSTLGLRVIKKKKKVTCDSGERGRKPVELPRFRTLALLVLQGYLAHKKTPTPLGP